MRSALICGCLGLISISSLAGCGHFNSSRDDCVCNGRPVPPMAVRTGVAVQSSNGSAAISGSSRPITAPTAPIVGVEPLRQSPEPDKLPVPTPPAAIAAVPEPAPSNIETVGQSQPERRGMLSQEDIETAFAPSSPSRVEGDHDARAKDITMAPRKAPVQDGHSEDFKTVTGKVQMWRGTVRLRYAPIDQEDAYGGFVILEGGAELTRMRDGEHVRIRGVLIVPENRNAAAHFRVHGLEILD